MTFFSDILLDSSVTLLLLTYFWFSHIIIYSMVMKWVGSNIKPFMKLLMVMYCEHLWQFFSC